LTDRAAWPPPEHCGENAAKQKGVLLAIPHTVFILPLHGRLQKHLEFMSSPGFFCYKMHQ